MNLIFVVATAWVQNGCVSPIKFPSQKQCAALLFYQKTFFSVFNGDMQPWVKM